MELSFRSLLTQPSGWLGSLFKEGILRPLSWGYGAGVALRNGAFTKGWLPVHRPPNTYIVSIGNIAVGGTGKTPLTVMVAEAFSSTVPVAIISRGYRSVLGRKDPLMVSDGGGPRFSASGCGDEPYLMAARLPGVLVIIGRDRVAAAAMAAKHGARLIIVDDGFQHRWLGRDSDIVVIDGRNPLSLGHLLPRGLQREGLASLERATLLVINHIRDRSHFEEVRGALSRYTRAPSVGTAMEVVQICGSHDTLPPSFCGLRVAAFCGIANPQPFVQMVADLGAEVVTERFFGDHTLYNEEMLLAWACQARSCGADWLVCTEKDAVKVHPFSTKLPLPLLWPQMRLRVVAEEDQWNRWLYNVQHLLMTPDN